MTRVTRRVGEVMLQHPKVSGRSTTVGEARALLARAKVHNALVVDDVGRLLAVVEPADLEGRDDAERAVDAGALTSRTVHPDDELDDRWSQLRVQGRRRLAVVDDGGVLVGLLCLKRHGAGFCTDADVRAREAEREGQATSHQASENAAEPATRLPVT
ncbi:CBS domain-containing protein [Nocardioides nanhaiensis]|uniref:CBS domain-containing protein n=1 Tax=Nocardioides nanhaiensis TaxID=1476871 RepID=UPI0031E9369B